MLLTVDELKGAAFWSQDSVQDQMVPIKFYKTIFNKVAPVLIKMFNETHFS